MFGRCVGHASQRMPSGIAEKRHVVLVDAKSCWTTGSGIDAAAIREIAALPSRRARSYTLLNDIGGSKCRCC